MLIIQLIRQFKLRMLKITLQIKHDFSVEFVHVWAYHSSVQMSRNLNITAYIVGTEPDFNFGG